MMNGKFSAATVSGFAVNDLTNLYQVSLITSNLLASVIFTFVKYN